MKKLQRAAALLLILCMAFAALPAFAQTYKEGDAGAEIMALKQRMLELG